MYIKLHNSQINISQWDDCILSDEYPHVYSLSWYLNVVCPNWVGLVFNKYSQVFPISLKIKYGLKYIAQPQYSQQYKIYGKNETDSTFLKDVNNELKKYKSIRTSTSFKLFDDAVARRNYILPIDSEYSEISKNFNDNCKRNIKKSVTRGVVCKKISVTQCIEFYSAVHQNFDNTIAKEIMNAAFDNYAFMGFGAFENNVLTNVAGFIVCKNILFYLFPASNAAGKENGGMYALINHCIQEYCCKDFIIDFEGSEIEGIARFYKGFGATETKYFYQEKHSLFFKAFI